MRDKSGRLGMLMVGSAIALALAATPYAIDSAGLVLDAKSAAAKDHGGGKGGKGGDKGDKGNKGNKGGEGGGGGSNGHEGGEGGGGSSGGEGGEGGGDGNNGGGAEGHGGDDGGEGGEGGSSGNNGGAGSGSGGNGGDDGSEGGEGGEGGSGETGGGAAESGDAAASADAEPVGAQAAAASVDGAEETLPVRRVIDRKAAQRSAVAGARATVRIRTVRGQPPPDRDGAERRGRAVAAAPTAEAALPEAEDVEPAVTPCATGVSAFSCPPIVAPTPSRPAIDIVSPAIEPAAGPEAPRDPVPDPAQTQLAYAVPRTGLEPEPLPDIDENIYGLMQVEAMRYVDTTIPILIVQGLVFNMSRSKRLVPPLVAIVSDADGNELARWKFIAEAPALEPGASTGFRSETVDPAPDSTRVTVVFARQDDPQVASDGIPIEPR